MADLSPAAQAVLNAALPAYDEEHLYVATAEQHASMIAAAALRAAAERTMRGTDYWNGSMPDDYDCGWNDGVRSLLAIAAELEGAQ